MTDPTDHPDNNGEEPPRDGTQRPRPSRGLSNAQGLLLILFIGSTGVLLAVWLGWGRAMIPLGSEPPLEIPPGSAPGLVWLMLAAVTALASLTGLVSTTVLGWRKEQREARAEALARRKQELEIQKLELELARAQALAESAGQQADQTGFAELPSPEAGERLRLQDQWAELDRRYQDATRHIESIDRDLAQTLDGERRLVLQERRDELAARRDAIAAVMAGIERRMAELDRSG